MEIRHKALSDKVLGCAFTVHNILGPGFLESAYEAALEIELEHEGMEVERQVVFPLYYRGRMAGAYNAGMVVERKLVLELKSAKELECIAPCEGPADLSQNANERPLNLLNPASIQPTGLRKGRISAKPQGVMHWKNLGAHQRSPLRERPDTEELLLLFGESPYPKRSISGQ